MHGRAQPVAEDLGVPLGAHRRPHQRRDQVGHSFASSPLADPAEHVGLGGAVEEPAAVRSLRAQRLEERIEPSGLVVGATRLADDPPVELAHLGVGVGVLLAEPHTTAHVEQVLGGRAGIPALGQLRDIVHDVLGRVEQPAVGQDPGDARDDRLGDRQDRVRLVRSTGRLVGLGDQGTVLENGVGVGERVGEDVGNGGPGAVDAGDLDGRYVVVRCPVGERADRTVAAGDRVRREDFAEMPESPPVERGVLPVGR